MDSRIQAQFQQMQRGFQAQQVPRTVTAADTLRLTDYLVACDATSAAFTLTLPAVKDAKGMSFLVVKTDSSANAVTIDGADSETINGATTLALSRQWNGVTIYCDGTQWITVIPSALLAASLTLSTGPISIPQLNASPAFRLSGDGGGITLANDATQAFPTVEAGLAFFYNATDGGLLFVAMPTHEVFKTGSWSTTKDNASTVNFYLDSGSYYLQNKIGHAVDIRGFIDKID